MLLIPLAVVPWSTVLATLAMATACAVLSLFVIARRWALIGATWPNIVCALLTLSLVREDMPSFEPVRQVLRKLDWAGAFALLASIVTLIVGARFVPLYGRHGFAVSGEEPGDGG